MTKGLAMSGDDDFPFPLFVKPSKANRFDFKKVKEEAGLIGNRSVNVAEANFSLRVNEGCSSSSRKIVEDSNVSNNKESVQKKFNFKTSSSKQSTEIIGALGAKRFAEEVCGNKKVAEDSNGLLDSVNIKEPVKKKFSFKTTRSKQSTEESVKNSHSLQAVCNDKNCFDASDFTLESGSVKQPVQKEFTFKTSKKTQVSLSATKPSSSKVTITDFFQSQPEKNENETPTKKFNFKAIKSSSDSSPNVQDGIKDETSVTTFEDDLDLNDIDWNTDVFDLNTTINPFIERKDDSAEFRRNYPHTDVMNEVLHQKFGLQTYRPLQEEIINASLTQHDCFVLMPTGGGKSLCYQLPALLTPGVTIVISPLRALISDQVDKLNALDIPAAHLCSDVKKTEIDVILSKLYTREPLIKLLYLTPEKIVASKCVSDLLNTLYKRDKLARFVIDEVHCLSQWGHDFRPDYKKLSNLRCLYPNVPIMCLTATATNTVQSDVFNILKLKNVKTFIRGFNRPNIKYQVLPKTNRFMVQEISELIKRKFHRKSGIIYCLCRADCEKLAMELCRCGIKAKAYHAGMSDSAREREQREWMQDQFHVIVATIAFGMGIDKPDVRFVIHVSIPKSVEAFYQESGRAGRDGEPSYSYLFYSYGDVGRLQRLMKLDKSVNKRSLEGHFDALQKMAVYCENKVDCRRYLQLLHLGEEFDRKFCMEDPITVCDNCENIKNYEMIDVTNRAKELAQIVEDLALRQNVTMIQVADVYKGCKIKKIIDLGYDKHPFYGRGNELRKSDIHRILKELVFRKILADHCQFTGEFPIVYIKPGSKYRKIKETYENLIIPVEKTSTTTTPRKYTEIIKTTPTQNKNDGKTYRIASLKIKCHEELLEICQKLAQERSVTLSSIMNLSAIKTMAELLPTTEAEYLKIQHVTRANFSKFGGHFLPITKKYKELVAPLEKPPTVTATTTIDVDDENDFRDWCERAGPSMQQGRKRKVTAGGKKGAKRYKKAYGRKKWKGGSGGAKQKGKRTPSKAKKKKGKIDLMPIVHVS